MAALDDLPLDSGRDGAPTAAPTGQSSSGTKLAVLVAVFALALAAGVWFFMSRPSTSQANLASSAVVEPPFARAIVDDPAVVVLPPAGEMDPYVRTLFATLSTHPQILKWLATDDLIASIATAVDKLAQGQSPARDLAVLRPTDGFTMTKRDGVALVAPASYSRYAPLAAAVASVDPARLATAFVTLRPRIADAYARQGHPDGGLDQAITRAIAVVASTPDVPGDAALVPGKGGYAYANPAFESLPAAQKQIIRMGPDHARKIREAARLFGEALTASAVTR